MESSAENVQKLRHEDLQQNVVENVTTNKNVRDLQKLRFQDLQQNAVKNIATSKVVGNTVVWKAPVDSIADDKITARSVAVVKAMVDKAVMEAHKATKEVIKWPP